MSSRHVALLLVALIAALARPALAGTTTTLVRGDTLNARDAYLIANPSNQRNGTATELDLKDAKNAIKSSNVVLDFNLPNLTGRTVLQAWLRMRQFFGSKPRPSTIRVYPVTQSWVENEVTWAERSAGIPWATPGGSHSPYWSDRVLASNATNGNLLSWQVGPILAAYQNGALGISGSGFFLKADGTTPDREVRFRSSEFSDTTVAPLLEITSTDLPPPVASGWAEIQPHQAAEYQSAFFTVYVEEDLAGSTPSGTPTGFDIVRLQHGGSLLVSGIDAVSVGSTSIPIGSVSFTNDPTGCTIQLPQPVTQSNRIAIRFRATVQVGIAAREFAVPVLVRHSTSAAGYQALWPQNADGVAGNGDDLIVTVFTTSTSVRVMSVTGPGSVSPGQNDALFHMRVRNSGTATVSINAADLIFTRSQPGDADAEFQVSSDPGNPDTLLAGAEKVLNLLVDVLPSAIPGSLTADGQLVVLDANTGTAYADLSADTTLAFNVTGSGAFVDANQNVRSVLPGESGVELITVDAANGSIDPTYLTQLTLTNTTSGPGTVAQRDAELDSLAVYLDDGDGTYVPGSETLLGRDVFSGGSATFVMNVLIPAKSGVRLFVIGDVSLSSRDGDVLDLEVENGNVILSPSMPFENTWPVNPPGGFTVNGMAAAQITVHPVPPRNLNPGNNNELLLDVTLPCNGYEADVLQRINVANVGTAVAGTDLARVELWRDLGNPGYDASEDRLLGTLNFTGARWEITGLSESIPVTGARFFVTGDVASSTTRPSTIRFSIPSGEDQGIGMASRNSGPLDTPVSDPSYLLITIPDRVTVVADPITPGTAAPGRQSLILLDLTATNTYASNRTLNQISFVRTGIGAGTQAEQDGNVRVLHLRQDGNHDGILDDLTTDPLLGTASFSNGIARFGGFEAAIAPGSSERFFLTADVSLSARDGDVMGAAVNSPLDLEFAEPTSIEGTWPSTSGAIWTVDGMVAEQISVPSAGASTLGPGSGPVLAFDFQLPGNGYQSDALNGIRIVNQGDATPADLSELRLWQDGGNGTFDSGGGDDTDLGALVLQGNAWQSLSMSIALAPAGARFFVSLTVSPTFTDSALVALQLPVNSVIMASGNDGPVDAPVSSGHVIALSDAPLLAQLALSPSPSTTGQSVTATLTVENHSAETILGVTPAPLTQSGSGQFAAPGSPVPSSRTLAPGASGTFQWSLTPAQAGDVTLSTKVGGTGQTSLLVRTSLTASTTIHQIFQEANLLNVSALEFMPYSVTVGQGGVVPLNLTFTNPGDGLTSPVSLSALRIRLEDEMGGGIVPSDLLSEILISEGQTIFADKLNIETAGSTVDVALGPPYSRVRVSPGDPVTLSLQLRMHPTTPVTKFRVVIQDASWFTAKDAVSDHPVTVALDSGSFPVRTGLANVVSEAVLVRARAALPDTLHIGPGQINVSLLDFTLENVPGTGAPSTVRVGSLTVRAYDLAGAPLAHPDSACASLSLEAGGVIVSTVALNATTSDSLRLDLSPPLVLVEGTPVQMRLLGHISDPAAVGGVRFRLGAESSLDARDVNTENAVAVNYLPSPCWGNIVWLENRATTLRAGGAALFAAVTTVGDKNVPALALDFVHPGSAGTARIAVDSLTFGVRDDRGQLLAPGPILDRIAVVWNGQEIAAQGLLSGSPQLVTLALPGIALAPGEMASASIVVDIDAGAPATSFQITLHQDGILARDANLANPVSVLPLASAVFPFTSGITQVRSPSRELWVGLESLLPAVLSADSSEVKAARITFRNPAADGATGIRIRSLRIAAADRNRNPEPIGDAVTAVALFRQGVLWAENAALTVDSTGAWIAFPSELDVLPGKTETLELRVTLSSTASVTSLRLGCDRADVGVVQPGGAALSIALVPETGQSFPLWTETGNFGAMSLEKSYANFPNPFAAGREQTSFVYYLPQNGRVTLRIWTLRGDAVTTVIRDSARPAGLHQEDAWDGRNGSGDAVVNGVYLAELTVAFDNGQSKRLLRKVAVVR
jgi:hypothetical protein